MKLEVRPETPADIAAIREVNRLAFGRDEEGALVDALHRSDFDLLARSLEDSIAEPRRAPLVPGLSSIKKAAIDAGALGSSLSGSGPSIFALCRDRATADRVAVAMAAAVKAAIGGESQTYVSSISSLGARVIG